MATHQVVIKTSKSIRITAPISLAESIELVADSTLTKRCASEWEIARIMVQVLGY